MAVTAANFHCTSSEDADSQPGPTRPSLHTTPSLLHPHALQLPPLDLLWYWWDCSLLQRHGYVLVEHRAACLHHQQCGAPSCSCDEMMERCTAYSTVASGASAEALIEKCRCFLATCCSGKRAIGAARQAVPLSLSGDGHLHAMVSLRSVWWCRAAFCCLAIATAQWNCSGGSQGRLLSASFWRGLHLPVYLGLWPVLGLTAPHVIFVRIRRFGASKPEKISGPQAHVTGAWHFRSC